MSEDAGAKPKCFIAMPITTTADHLAVYNDDSEHWLHVMESLFVPAVEAAGYEAVRPITKGAYMIHQVIVENLEKCDLVLVDLSAHNPNVFFELGLRTALDRPVALVSDGMSNLPFDTSGVNTYEYDPSIAGWKLDEQRQSLAQHIRDSDSSCKGRNPLWRIFGLTQRAQEPDIAESPTEARLDLLMSRMDQLQSGLTRLANDAELARLGVDETDLDSFTGRPFSSVVGTHQSVQRLRQRLRAVFPDGQVSVPSSHKDATFHVLTDDKIGANRLSEVQAIVNAARDLKPTVVIASISEQRVFRVNRTGTHLVANDWPQTSQSTSTEDGSKNM